MGVESMTDKLKTQVSKVNTMRSLRYKYFILIAVLLGALFPTAECLPEAKLLPQT
jgi:hypothetical protein